MKTIRLDVADSIFDDDIVSFFQNSPLKDELKLERSKEQYTGRVDL